METAVSTSCDLRHAADCSDQRGVRRGSSSRRSETPSLAEASHTAEANHSPRSVHTPPLASDRPKRRLSLNRQIFLDPEEMKRQVRQNLLKNPNSVVDLYGNRGLWQKIARHPWFENFTLFIIGMNAVWIAVDTDWNDAEIPTQADPIFQIAENFFCVFFSFEITVRFLSFKSTSLCCRDRWFMFDGFLVLLMVLETWVVTLVMLLSDDSSDKPNMGSTSILRLFRLLRLSRMARMLRSMPELVILIKGMLAAMRSVFFVMCFLVIIMYVFAIAFTQLTEGMTVGELYFRSVGVSMYSLLLYGIFLDNVGGVSEKIRDDSFLCLILFIIFILLSAFTVMNMLIGVLCEIVSAVASTEKEEFAVNFVKLKLKDVLDHMDNNCDGVISRGEFTKMLEQPASARALHEVGVDPVGLVDFMDFIFDDKEQELEADDADIAKVPRKMGLHFGEFMDMVLKLRGSNHATVKDIVDLRKCVSYSIKQIMQAVQSGSCARQPQACRLMFKEETSQVQVQSTVNSPSQLLETRCLKPCESPPDGTSGGDEHEAVRRLQKRVKCIEETLIPLLHEVRKLGQSLPPPLPATEQRPHF